jgi:2-polyprenyl-3-methyl-5-hydroxy-6-metoxy-1,4-benzoquinol methylase
MEQYFEANKVLWNEKVDYHKDAAFYRLEQFKQGENVLNNIEMSEVGDVNGRSLLHLQCHFGMDTLSWARLGATVTGVDFSEKAIDLARSLSAELQIPAQFVCSNIYDLKENHTGKYDIVFTSYGTIGWLPDLTRWAAVIAHFLKPGGFFYIADFHPVLWMMDDNFEGITYAYHNAAVIESELTGTYADRNAPIKRKEYGWNHSFSELINALIGAGLQIELLNEYPYSPYPCFNNLVETEPGKWQVKGLEDKLPMMYSLRAGLSR